MRLVTDGLVAALCSVGPSLVRFFLPRGHCIPLLFQRSGCTSKRRIFFFFAQRASNEARISRNSPAFLVRKQPTPRGITGSSRAFSSSRLHPSIRVAQFSRSRGHRYLYGLLFISRPRLKMLSNEAASLSGRISSSAGQKN